MYKRRLDQKGLVIPDTVEKHKVGPEQDDTLLHKGNETECGSCYGAGAEEECCNTCDEVSQRGSRPSCAQMLCLSPLFCHSVVGLLCIHGLWCAQASRQPCRNESCWA